MRKQVFMFLDDTLEEILLIPYFIVKVVMLLELSIEIGVVVLLGMFRNEFVQLLQ